MTMIRGETPAPVRHPSAPGDPRCEDARQSVSALLGSGRMLADEPALREHLRTCEDCNALYRSSLIAETRFRRTLLDCERGHEPGSGAPERRALLSPLAVARAGFTASGRGKASWVLGLGVIAYAAVRLTPDAAGASGAHVQALCGEVLSTGEPLRAGASPRELARGDWIKTTEKARASLTFGDTRVQIAPSSALQIEEPGAPRLRLEAGALEVDGALLVTSPFGVVQVESGHAKLRISGEILFVETAVGGLRTIDAHGEHVLESGESMQLAFAR